MGMHGMLCMPVPALKIKRIVVAGRTDSGRCPHLGIRAVTLQLCLIGTVDIMLRAVHSASACQSERASQLCCNKFDAGTTDTLDADTLALSNKPDARAAC